MQMRLTIPALTAGSQTTLCRGLAPHCETDLETLHKQRPLEGSRRICTCRGCAARTPRDPTRRCVIPDIFAGFPCGAAGSNPGAARQIRRYRGPPLSITRWQVSTGANLPIPVLNSALSRRLTSIYSNNNRRPRLREINNCEERPSANTNVYKTDTVIGGLRSCHCQLVFLRPL